LRVARPEEISPISSGMTIVGKISCEVGQSEKRPRETRGTTGCRWQSMPLRSEYLHQALLSGSRWIRANHSVIVAGLAFTASIVGFNTTETPGSASTLSNNWFSVGINVLTNPAAILR
jgi:hypothetical protein